MFLIPVRLQKPRLSVSPNPADPGDPLAIRCTNGYSQDVEGAYVTFDFFFDGSPFDSQHAIDCPEARYCELTDTADTQHSGYYACAVTYTPTRMSSVHSDQVYLQGEMTTLLYI